MAAEFCSRNTDRAFRSSRIVVDLAVQPKGGPARQRQLHTHGATAAMLASTGEYFHALRDARQKFSILVMREITQAVKAKQQVENVPRSP